MHRQCSFSPGGSAVCMNYSQFLRPSDALDDYGRLGSATTRTIGKTVVVKWKPTYSGSAGCNGLTYKGAKMVRGQRWGVPAYADSASAVSNALARFGEFRPIQEWNGAPR